MYIFICLSFTKKVQKTVCTLDFSAPTGLLASLLAASLAASPLATLAVLAARLAGRGLGPSASAGHRASAGASPFHDGGRRRIYSRGLCLVQDEVSVHVFCITSILVHSTYGFCDFLIRINNSNWFQTSRERSTWQFLHGARAANSTE